MPNILTTFEGLPSQGGSCSLVPFQNCPMFPCSHTLSECFRIIIFRNFVPCSQKLANVPLFPSIFCQCSLVPQNPWETLTFWKKCLARRCFAFLNILLPEMLRLVFANILFNFKFINVIPVIYTLYLKLDYVVIIKRYRQTANRVLTNY